MRTNPTPLYGITSVQQLPVTCTNDAGVLENIRWAQRAVALAVMSYGGLDALFIEAKQAKSWWTSTNCYVIPYPDHQLCVFTGTNGLVDWLFDVAALPVNYGKGRTHAGFAAAHRSVWKKVKKLLDPTKPTYFVGHSLGGALAELSTEFMDSPCGFITYGKPHTRADGKACPDLSHLLIKLSVINCSDVVPTVPELLFQSTPGQDVLYIDNDGVTHFNCPKEYRDKDRKRNRLVKDHLIKQYAHWLAKITKLEIWETKPNLPGYPELTRRKVNITAANDQDEGV